MGRPLKLTPEMKTDMIAAMERAEKNSNWRERHEEVRILKDDFPELLAVEEEDTVTCREKCAVFGRYHCLDHVRVETNAANSEARNDSYVMLLTNEEEQERRDNEIARRAITYKLMNGEDKQTDEMQKGNEHETEEPMETVDNPMDGDSDSNEDEQPKRVVDDARTTKEQPKKLTVKISGSLHKFGMIPYVQKKRIERSKIEAQKLEEAWLEEKQTDELNGD